MIRFAWVRILSRKLISITILLAFIGLYTLIPLGFQSTKEIKLAVNHSVEEYGRGTYDILVRPSSTRTDVEKKLGMIEENYIGDGGGGISISDWEQIKRNPDIELAAPVASLGYFSGKRMSIELPVLKEPTRFSWQFYTSDGIHKYPIDQKEELYYFDGSVPGNIQYIDASYPNSLTGVAMTVLMPFNYYLLAAIDVESESKLTGIDYSELDKEINDIEFKEVRESLGNPPVIKVIQRQDINIPLYMTVKTDRIDVDLGEYQEKLGLMKDDSLLMGYEKPEKMEQVINELSKAKALDNREYNLDLSKFQKPFEGTAVKIGEDFSISETDRFMSDQDTSIYYIASKINYKINENNLEVPILEDRPPPIYKTVNKKGISAYQSQKVPFIIEQVGEFSPNKDTNQLASSPLGIYSTTESKSLDGKVVQSTIFPGSFIPTPASGITTLEAAEMVKGQKPIDAIRIKVAGINKYNVDAQEKIEQVAIDLLKSGYEVDIVAGSSFKQMRLDVEGLGQILEPWTTLGVAQELSENWNHMSVISFILFSLFGFLWLYSRVTFEKKALYKEDELLYLLGWKRKFIFLRNCLEQFIIITIGYVVSIILFTLFKQDAFPYLLSSLLWFLTVVMVCLLFLRNGSGNKTRIMEYKKVPAIIHYKEFILPTIFVLFISIILLIIQISNLGYSIEKAKETTLGQFTMDETLIIQISIIVITVLLSYLAVSESITALLQYRAKEFSMYHIIGWTKGRILIHFSKEISLWSGVPIVLGVLLGSLILFGMNVSYSWIFISILISIGILSIAIVVTTITKLKPFSKG